MLPRGIPMTVFPGGQWASGFYFFLYWPRREGRIPTSSCAAHRSLRFDEVLSPELSDPLDSATVLGGRNSGCAVTKRGEAALREAGTGSGSGVIVRVGTVRSGARSALAGNVGSDSVTACSFCTDFSPSTVTKSLSPSKREATRGAPSSTPTSCAF